jgi:hypothetical protein
MRTSKRILLIAMGVILVSLLMAAVYARRARALDASPLGIEIALSKPFYVPAATGGKTTMIVIRVPVAEGASQGQDAVSAIKLEPKMEGDKVKVSVYALIGEADNIKTCRDWDALKSMPVGTYVAGLDEEVSLVKLRDFGVSMGNDPLTFRVVPKRTLSPLPNEPGGGCDCASCGGLICCPNPGYCIGCGSCGSVCCGG